MTHIAPDHCLKGITFTNLSRFEHRLCFCKPWWENIPSFISADTEDIEICASFGFICIGPGIRDISHKQTRRICFLTVT